MILLADILHDEDVDATYHAEMEEEPFGANLTGRTLDPDIAAATGFTSGYDEIARTHNGRPFFADVDEYNTVYRRYLDTRERIEA